MPSATVVISVLAVCACVILAKDILSRAAQPLRREMAQKGEALLADPMVPRDFKTHIRFVLDHAFSMRFALVFGILFLPFIAIVLVVRARLLLPFALDPRRLAPGAREAFEDVILLHKRVTLANHPVLMSIFYIESNLCMILAVIARAVFKGFIPQDIDEDFVLTIIEDKSVVVRDRMRWPHTFQRAA